VNDVTLPVLLDGPSTDRLTRLARTGAAGPLVILQAPTTGLGLTAGRWLAACLVPDGDAAAHDVHVAEPGGARWTVAELRDQVLAPAGLTPVHRTVVVVAQADAVDVQAAQMLLKTVEEPSAGALFVFVTRDLEAVLPTILGRAAAVIRLAPAGRDRQIGALAEAGTDPGDAGRWYDLCGGDPVLLAGLAGLAPDRRSAVCADLGTLLSAVPSTAPPATLAAVLGDAAARVAASLGSGTARVDSRTLLHAVLARWRSRVAVLVRDCERPDRFQGLVRCLAAIDDAAADLDARTSPAAVFTGLLYRFR
jgi:hypothetical protein